MNNPLRIGIMKTREPKNPNKLRALSINIGKYNYFNDKKKISKDRSYLLDGKIKLNNTSIVKEHKKEKVSGIIYSLEIPIKYTKSGVIGLNVDSDPVIYKSIFINLVLSPARVKILEDIIDKLNKFRKAADKEYFNRFNNNRINLSFYTITKDGTNLVKKIILDGPTKELKLNMEFKD